MHRFYISPSEWRPEALVLRDREFHHAVNVLRLAEGDKAVVFDGQGREATVEVTGVTKHEAALKIRTSALTPPLPCRIELGQAVPKGKQVDLIIEKATELGAAAIHPLLSDRTVVKLDDAKDAQKKREKWQVIATDAAKQCGQNYVPEISQPRSMREFLDTLGRYDLKIIASLQPDSRRLPSILADFREGEGRDPRSVIILIGPEGDFTPAEISQAKSRGFMPMTLGPIILRSETASIYALCALSYELLVGKVV